MPKPRWRVSWYDPVDRCWNEMVFAVKRAADEFADEMHDTVKEMRPDSPPFVEITRSISEG